MGRSSAKPARPAHRKQEEDGETQEGCLKLPTKCQLCGTGLQNAATGLNSAANMFEHLGSVLHYQKLSEHVEEALPLEKPPGPNNFAGVLELLQASRELHIQLGFDVDALQRAAPALEQ